MSPQSAVATCELERPVRVLVVDDAAFMIKAIRELLEADPGIEVVGTARNGREALDGIASLQPDVITLDIDMPVMDGIKTIRHLMIESPVPVVVLSSLFRDGAITFEALRLGVVDFLAKPSGAVSQDIHEAKQRLIDRIKMAAEVHLDNVRRVRLLPWDPRAALSARYGYRSTEYLLTVGTTLGGPNTSVRMFTQLTTEFPVAAVFMQELAPNILPAFAQKFDEHVPWKVVAGEDGMVLEAGSCVVCSTERTATIGLNGDNEPCLNLSDASERPLDRLLTSAADVFAKHTIGVLLTGIGSDGTEGFRNIRSKGGVTIAQNARSAVYPNLAEHAIRSGVVDIVVDEKTLVHAVEDWIRSEQASAPDANGEAPE